MKYNISRKFPNMLQQQSHTKTNILGIGLGGRFHSCNNNCRLSRDCKAPVKSFFLPAHGFKPGNGGGGLKDSAPLSTSSISLAILKAFDPVGFGAGRKIESEGGFS
jgi:hypothetical protein